MPNRSSSHAAPTRFARRLKQAIAVDKTQANFEWTFNPKVPTTIVQLAGARCAATHKASSRFDHLASAQSQVATVIAIGAIRAGRALVRSTSDLAADLAQAEQGSFTPRSQVTMYLQGYYSVASAETGQLRLQISDQNGPLGGTLPQTVFKGGDFFGLSATFVVPEDSTEVCRTAILEVASVRIAEPTSNASGLWCLPVRR